MKLFNVITISVFTTIFVVSSFFPRLNRPKEVLAQSHSKLIAILVNGNGDCCAWKMTDVIGKLNDLGAVVIVTPWDKFSPKGAEGKPISIFGYTLGSRSNDSNFVTGLPAFVNNIPADTQVIIIGHSFGGDSVLKAVPRINRRIRFLGTLDPVGEGGLARPIRNRNVPSTVDYFFNRWQTTNAWPVENRTPGADRNRSVSCAAKVCDQQEQSTERNADGSEIREDCSWLDPTCPGSSLVPPRKGKAAKRLQHEDVPVDAYIQKQIIDNISSLLANTGYFESGGTTYYADSSGYCGFRSGGHYQIHRFGHDKDIARLGNRSPSEFGTYTGACPIPSGYFAYDNATHYSKGDGTFCSFFTAAALDKHGSQRPNEPRFGILESNPRDFMNWAGGCDQREPDKFTEPALANTGYFESGGTTYYADSSGYCGFRSGGHYQIHRFGHDTDIARLGNRSPSEFGTYTGACPIPSGYFAYDNATHYSKGDGTFCSFFTAAALDKHGSQRPNEPRFGILESNPRDFMNWAGGCDQREPDKFTEPAMVTTTKLPTSLSFLKTTLTGHSDSVNSVAFSPDGKTLASGGKDDTIKIWNLSTGRPTRTLTGHSDEVNSVAFSPDGKTLASGSGDDTIKIWNLSTGRLTRTLTGHSGAVYSLAFSPDGKTLVSGSLDDTIKIWNLSTGRPTRTLTGHSGAVYSLAFSPDGKTLASGGSGDDTIKIWHLSTGQPTRTLTTNSGAVYSLAFSPDGKTLASGGSENGITKIWDLSTGQPTRTLTGNSDEVNSVAFSPDGKTLASANGDKTITIWDLSTGQPTRTLTGNSDSVNSVAFSPDGKTLASGSRDDTIKIWDLSK